MGLLIRLKLVAALCILFLRRNYITLDLTHLVHNIFCLYHRIKGVSRCTPPKYSSKVEKSDILAGYKRPSIEYYALNSILKGIIGENHTLQQARDTMSNSPLLSISYDRHQTHSPMFTTSGVNYYHSVSEEVTNHHNAIMYIHGGGYCLGSAKSCLGVSAKFGKLTRTEVFSLDYGLAPENLLNDQVNEALKFYEYISTIKKKVVIIGDSAGGGLVQATLQKIKQQNLQQPNAACMISPWLDISLSGESHKLNEKTDLIVSKSLMELFKNALIKKHGSIEKVNDALFYNCDLSGLCPMYITASQDEVLFSDSSKFVERAREANCDITFESSPYGVHCYPTVGTFVPESNESLLRICQFMKYHLGLSG